MNSTDINQILEVDVNRIKADIEHLCQSPRHSSENPEAHKEAAQHIAESLRSSGCDAEEQVFMVPAESTERPGLNVIGTLQPNESGKRPTSHSPSAVLIGAHYDTVPGSPGADDNASGVAAMLECARILGNMDRKRPLIFAAFDAEERQPEVGLHGSTAYAGQLKERNEASQIKAAYILEMVGFTAPAGEQKVPTGLQFVFPRAFDRLLNEKFAGNSVVTISDRKSRNAGQIFEEAARMNSEALPVLPLEVPRWLPVPHNLKRSDHAPFWDAGIPAVMIGDTANFRNPNYHTPTDTPVTLDYGLIRRVTEAIARVAVEHATQDEPVPKRKVKLR